MAQSSPRNNKLRHVIRDCTEEFGGEIFLLSGAIVPGLEHTFMDQCPNPPSYSKAMLFVQTNGGDAGVAYRIAACLQTRYRDGFTLFTDAWCVSAGTLLALGARELRMTDHAQLGPLDVQLAMPDEVFERQSGLVPLQALRNLHEETFKLWEACFLELRLKSSGQITTKTAADIAATLTNGLMGELYAQIDPLRVADTYRSMQVAQRYGERLAKKSNNNVRHGTVSRLVIEYPAHDYVIDRNEAKELFVNVESPSTIQQQMADIMAPVTEDYFHRSAVHEEPPALLNLTEWAASTPSKKSEKSEKGNQREQAVKGEK